MECNANAFRDQDDGDDVCAGAASFSSLILYFTSTNRFYLSKCYIFEVQKLESKKSGPYLLIITPQRLFESKFSLPPQIIILGAAGWEPGTLGVGMVRLEGGAATGKLNAPRRLQASADKEKICRIHRETRKKCNPIVK